MRGRKLLTGALLIGGLNFGGLPPVSAVETATDSGILVEGKTKDDAGRVAAALQRVVRRLHCDLWRLVAAGEPVDGRAVGGGPGGRSGPDGQSDPSTKSTRSTPSTKSTYPEIAANGAMALLAVACTLLDRQIATLEKAFVEEGGFTERLHRVRSAHRQTRRP